MKPKISVITSLYRCDEYLNRYFEAVEQIVNKEECEFILIHNSPLDNEKATIKRWIEGKDIFKYYEVQREPLYASWNRGIKLASGIYIANWNVDDLRTPTSLLEQAKALDSTPKAAVAYGDTITIKELNIREGKRNDELEYTKKNASKFKHSFYISCFPMWRKEIHEHIGYYDEQFSITGDFEFQVRIAHAYEFIKVNSVLGYFYGGSGGSRLSQQIKAHNTEDASIYIRYGCYHKINLCCLKSALKKDIFSIKQDDKFISINKFIPSFNKYKITKLLYLLPYNLIFRFPIDLLRYIKIYILKIPTRTN